MEFNAKIKILSISLVEAGVLREKPLQSKSTVDCFSPFLML
jgi:hypothetical protein